MDERQKKPIEDSLADRVEQLREEAARLPPARNGTICCIRQGKPKYPCA